MTELPDYRDAVRQCLVDLDMATMRKLWGYLAPHLPQPESDHDLMISMHYARTATESINIRTRAYSHSWLMERGLPSGLPDHMRARADRMFPRVVSAVGISVNYSSPHLAPVGKIVAKAMEIAVLEAHADGKLEDTAFLHPRMMAARERALKELMLPLRTKK